MSTTFKKMDKMYRGQRYIYDLTRKYFLLGRDRLIAQMNVQAGENILEVGCGTCRNLVILAKKHPAVNFFGLDASSEMLKTAQAKIDRENLKNIRLKIALAGDFNYKNTFDLDKPFNTIFFSYSISMIPTWKKSITNVLANLKSGGSFCIVDFYDQKDLPALFRKILKSWLKQFHVEFPSGLLPHLKDLEKHGLGRMEITSIARRYAFIAKFQKSY